MENIVKVARVIDLDEDVIEYNIFEEVTEKGVRQSIARSKASVWNEASREEEVLAIIDDGNEVIFESEFTKLDYGDSNCLMLLLCFNTQNQSISPNQSLEWL